MEESQITKKAVAGVKWTTISAIVSAIAKLLQVAILTRFLLKDDFGLVAIALLVNSFCAIFMDMGITAAVLHKSKIEKAEYSSLYWFSIFSGIILTLLASISAYPISEYYGEIELVNIVPLTSINIFLASVSGLQRTMQQKNMNFKFISIVEILSAIVMLIVSAALAILGFGIYSLVYSTIFNGLLIAVVYFVYGVFYEKNLSFHFKFSEIYDSLRIGIYQVGTSILDFFSSEMDILIISSSFSMSFLGSYTLCKQIVTRLFSLINPIITKILTPTLALYQDNISFLRKKYLEIIKVLAIINIPIYFLIAINAKEVLTILYGINYVENSYILAILAINYGILSLGNPVGSLIVATGKTNIGFRWTIFRIIVVSISLYFASSYSSKIFLLILLGVNVFNIYPSWYIIYRKLIYITFKELILSMFKPLLLCSILLFLYLIISLNIKNIILALILKTIIFAFSYLTIVTLLAKEDMLKIKNIILNK